MITINYKQQLSIGDILGEAKRLLFTNTELFKKIFIYFWLPFAIIMGISEVQYVFNTTAIAFISIIKIIAAVFLVTGSIAVVFASDNCINKKKVNFEVLKNKSWSKFWPVIGGSLVLGLLMILLFMAFVIPGIIFGVFWTFAIIVLLLKKEKIMVAMKYSKSLVQGKWWNVFGYLIVFGLFSFILILPAIIVLGILSLISGHVVFQVIINSVVMIYMYLISMFFAIVQVVYFTNLDRMYGSKTIKK